MSYLMIVLVKFVQLVSILLTGYMWVVIVSALLSWVNPDPYNPIVRFLRNATEPLYWRIRRWMPFVVVGGFDLSPIVVIFGVQIVTALLDRLVIDMAMNARMMGALASTLLG
ncbi:YggT family protein [Humidesulfovibrio mexicanus]|uniref:YggT family protein n=1 Tax=Humidesulfovibrio mexicanus TaxID=147047 RepID=A0A238XQV0_9BACT|nr:YggT family protein [Humidesulfovibrio mexicanus]SNR61345.1 YggT family protein [Humidesulfovibrio mexicanus]